MGCPYRPEKTIDLNAKRPLVRRVRRPPSVICVNLSNLPFPTLLPLSRDPPSSSGINVEDQPARPLPISRCPMSEDGQMSALTLCRYHSIGSNLKLQLDVPRKKGLNQHDQQMFFFFLFFFVPETTPWNTG